jgi:sucrose phosphorylase
MTSAPRYGPQLITYADRLSGSIPAVTTLLTDELRDAFDGVHLLPYFTPFDGTDAGFDPVDHTQVDPRLGNWSDVLALAQQRVVMSDVIVNHVSTRSPMFKDYLERGDGSSWAPMFLTLSSVFPDGATEAELASIYRPRPGLPFTAMTVGQERRLVWTTFTPDQVDLDLRSEMAWEYLEGVIEALTSAGVTMLRLDAVGYTGKQRGTSCFMTSATEAYTNRIMTFAHALGATVLLEVHGHYLEQVEIARTVDYVYDFALPPLVLHALHAQDLEPLMNWLQVRPLNCVTVLDTHDGIGIVDVGESDRRPGVPGLLTPTQIDALVEDIHRASGGTSRAATGAAASNLDLYQVNCTFYEALGSDDARYLLARIMQLMVPGIPQVYYVGLLAGSNDLELLRASGVGRDVNRHRYSPEEVSDALARPVVKAQLDALRLRREHEAFEGEFASSALGSDLVMTWTNGPHKVELRADVASSTFALLASGREGQVVRDDTTARGAALGTDSPNS